MKKKKGEEERFVKMDALKLMPAMDGLVTMSDLEKRCLNGDSDAQWMLGIKCEFGIGDVDKDIERAELLYQNSSEAGNPVGEFLYESKAGGRGTGVMDNESLLKSDLKKITKRHQDII